MGYIYDLLIFAGCLVLYIQCQTICKKDEYTVVRSDGSFVRCLNCLTCHRGRGLDPPCGSRIQDPPNPDCVDCPRGKFSDELDSAPCHTCQKCAEHEIVMAPCTSKSNRICNGTCEKGYFYSKKDSTHSCKKCSHCCFDGKDEEISECTNQGLNASKQHCRPRPDKDCSPVSSVISPTVHTTGTEASRNGSSITGGVIGGVFGGVGFIGVIVIALCLHLCRRKKKTGVPDAQQSGRVEEGNGKASCTSPYASEGPQVASTNTKAVKFTVPADTNLNPQVNLGLDKSALEPKLSEATAATPANQADDKIEKLTADVKKSGKPPLSRQSSRDSQNSEPKLSEATAATPTNQADDKIEKLTADVKKSGKPPLSRQSSRDSQNSGDGETGFRKRSNSAISLEKLKRKLSERDGSLLEEDLEEILEPVKIEKHPKSQKKKEGSRVEFKLKVQGNNRVLYQWLKDGVELLGKDDACLILECIELRDFGCYTCHVSYEDGEGEPVVSSSAVLDVIPQSRNGMRPKLLQEVDLGTRDKIASLLENKRYSLGGCRQVAAKYEMNEDKIGALDNSKEPGKDVMEFLMGSKPDLTVYSFCKVLKQDNIKRFDIVKLLEEHLLIRDGATYL